MSGSMCVRPIRMYVANMAKTYSMRMCLLYPDAGNLKGGSVDSQRLDHWHTVIWDPGIVDSRVLSVCYDCLCLMALFRAVMSWVHHWAECSVWTGPDAGYCRTMAWEERYLPRLHHPVVWIGCVAIVWRSTYLDLSLCLMGIGTLAPNGVLVRAGLRWGSFPQEGFN